jgi:hypothetical protein
MKNNSTYIADQYDDIEKLMDDAEKLLSNPNTRQEGRDLLSLAKTRIQRERNRIAYAAMTNQRPNIPPLEPAPLSRQIGEGK